MMEDQFFDMLMCDTIQGVTSSGKHQGADLLQ